MESARDWFRAQDDVLSTWLGDDGVVVDLRRKLYHTLNASAMVVFEAVENGNDVAAASEALLRRFRSSPERAREAARKALTRLVALGLVKAAARPA